MKDRTHLMTTTGITFCVVVLLNIFTFGVCDTASSSNQDDGSTVEIDRNAMGMSVLYDMVHYFLGNILHKQKISESFLSEYTLFLFLWYMLCIAF